MAEETATPENTDEELLLTEEVQPEGETHQEEPEEEEIPSFSDELPEDAPESPTIRHMREEVKKAHKRIAELEKSVTEKPKPISIEDLGPEPDLEALDWDADKFKAATAEYYTKKARLELQAEQAPPTNEAQQAEIEATRARIENEKQALNKPDVEDAFDTVRSSLTEMQQSLIVATAEQGNTAKLIYALAKNPDRLTALGAIHDIPKFIKEVAKLEGQLKMVKRRTAPDPDEPERGSAPVAKQGADKTLAKLEAEAERTGDRTKVIQYKRQLRQNAS